MLSEAIHRFFKQLKAIYGSKFGQQFSSAAEVDQSKMMWGEEITSKTDAQIDACLVNAKQMLGSRHKDYLWPNIGVILGFVETDSSWERKCHELYQPETLLENLTEKEANQEAGKKALQEMMALFRRA